MLKYQVIARKLNDYMKEKKLEQGDRLPNFNELCTKFSISRSTLVKALELLQQSGLVYVMQGSGVYVRRPRRDNYINIIDNTGFTKELNRNGTSVQSKVLEVVECPLPDKMKLLIKEDTSNETAYFVKRLRYKNGKVFCIEESYYRKAIVPLINPEIAKGSLFEYIEKGLGHTIGFSDKYIKVVKLSANDAALLELEKNDPALEMTENFYLSSGQLFDYSITRYHYLNSQFFLQGN